LPGHLLDIGVGRFPVSTKEEATNVVEKNYKLHEKYQKRYLEKSTLFPCPTMAMLPCT